MTKSEIKVGLNELITKRELDENSPVFQWVLNLENKAILRPVFNSRGSWSTSKFFDLTGELKMVLDRLGIEYETGNDAPKGGKTGYFVKITTTIEN